MSGKYLGMLPCFVPALPSINNWLNSHTPLFKEKIAQTKSYTYSSYSALHIH